MLRLISLLVLLLALTACGADGADYSFAVSFYDGETTVRTGRVEWFEPAPTYRPTGTQEPTPTREIIFATATPFATTALPPFPTLIPTLTPQPVRYCLNTSQRGLNVRSDARLSAPAVNFLLYGERVIVEGVQATNGQAWYLVRRVESSSTLGWVAGWLCTLEA